MISSQLDSTSFTLPEDKFVSDFLEEFWRVRPLPLDKVNQFEFGGGVSLALPNEYNLKQFNYSFT